MKMTAKSETEDDDSWIEAEIERELENLTIDSCPSDDENIDKITDENTADKNSYLLREVESNLPFFPFKIRNLPCMMQPVFPYASVSRSHLDYLVFEAIYLTLLPGNS